MTIEPMIPSLTRAILVDRVQSLELAMNRSQDWWAQSLRDLRHARNALQDTDYEWSAFAAHQSAEKAVKALIISQGGEPWGHLITGLLEALPKGVSASPEVVEAGNRLDKHYIPARYPNGFVQSYPGKLYTRGEAESAISDAEKISEFCRCYLSG